MSTSSSVTSPSPPPSRPSKKSKSSTSKPARKSNGADPRNEGVDPNRDFKPPTGFNLREDLVYNPDFDWDAMKADDDSEIWVIRVPNSLKSKHLNGIHIDLPPTTSQSVLVGEVARKHAKFDIWSIGANDDNQKPIGGEEIRGLTCLLPRKKKKGKLFQAPRPIARHLVLSAQEIKPTPTTLSITYQNPPRHSYPPNVLIHKFAPLGSGPNDAFVPEPAPMDVDVDSDTNEVMSSLLTEMAAVKSKAKSNKKSKAKADDDDEGGAPIKFKRKNDMSQSETKKRKGGEMDASVAGKKTKRVRKT